MPLLSKHFHFTAKLIQMHMTTAYISFVQNSRIYLYMWHYFIKIIFPTFKFFIPSLSYFWVGTQGIYKLLWHESVSVWNIMKHKVNFPVDCSSPSVMQYKADNFHILGWWVSVVPHQDILQPEKYSISSPAIDL